VIKHMQKIAVLSFALSSTAAAQTQIPVMMVHGFASSGSTWADLNANLLGSKFAPYTTNLSWTQAVTVQAGEVNTYMGLNSLGSSSYLVGHSMGGLTSRYTSRLRIVTGIITIGTPHQGTGIATSFGSLQDQIGGSLADELIVHTSLDDFVQTGSFDDPLYDAASNAVGQVDISYALWGVASAAAYGLEYWSQASLDDLRFGSPWRTDLNATETGHTLSKEAGIMCQLASGYYGGPLALVYPGNQADIMGLNLQVNAGFAEMNGLDLTFGYDASSELSFWDAMAAGGALEDYGLRLGAFSDWWTYTVVGGYPHDGVVPFTSQQYPGAAVIINGCLSPHTSETTIGVGPIRSQLNAWNP
jgi:pimeloyl-ACP methyl ester carboxylesterase